MKEEYYSIFMVASIIGGEEQESRLPKKIIISGLIKKEGAEVTGCISAYQKNPYIHTELAKNNGKHAIVKGHIKRKGLLFETTSGLKFRFNKRMLDKITWDGETVEPYFKSCWTTCIIRKLPKYLQGQLKNIKEENTQYWGDE